MIRIKIKELEKKLNRTVKKNFSCLGVDTATRTGWCIATTDNDYIEFDYGFVHIDSKNVFFRYDKMIESFKGLVERLKADKKECSIIIEDVFFGKNVNTLKVLSRIGMIVYIWAWAYNVPKSFILASQARKFIGFKGTGKKAEVHKQILERLDFKLKDDDIVDALVLALNGITEETKANTLEF